MKKYLFINLYDGGAVRNREFLECITQNRKVFDRVFVLSERRYEVVTNILCGGGSFGG